MERKIDFLYTGGTHIYVIIILKGVLHLAKKVKCEICGREFEMTKPEDGCPYCHGKQVEEAHDRNSMAGILKGAGWLIFIIGFIGSIILGSSVHFDSYSDFNYVVMMIGWISTGVSSLFLFAFSEIIQILHDIRKNK